MRTEIRIAGTGGMGVVLAGILVGHAAVVYGGLDAVQTQSYGSEARGTAAKSEVIISDKPIRYPKVLKSDYFVVMSQKALDLYLSGSKKGSVVIIDPDLVDGTDIANDYEVLEIPAMKSADKLGRRLVANMVMLGALIKKSGIFSIEVLEQALPDMVPEKTVELNVKAIRKGAALL
jgi:2-oxoglutarate ferredoxin oxidoreductase subunit gamma